MKRRKLFIFFISIILFISDFAFAQYENVKDHPALSRYKGSEVIHHDVREFDEYYLLLGPITRDVEKAKQKKIEGKVTKFTYRGPRHRSPLEVFKNYELALTQAGYKILFQGKGSEISGALNFLRQKNRHSTQAYELPGSVYYLSASSPDEKIFISLLVTEGDAQKPLAVVGIVEPKGIETGLVSAEIMEESIKRTGKVALYTIYFDFDKADLKPESKPTIEEIAKLLKRNPKLKLYIVGHTDNVGSFDYNMNLSQRRAEAVVKELVEKYGISKDRLKPYGVGPLCPVSSNLTEEGRSKNRRVELVEQ